MTITPEWAEYDARHARIRELDIPDALGRLDGLHEQLKARFSPAALARQLEQGLLQEVNEQERRLDALLPQAGQAFMLHLATPGVQIGEKELLKLHRLIFTGIPDPLDVAGQYRTQSISVMWSQTTFPPAEAVPGLMRAMLPIHEAVSGSPVLQAARVHFDLLHIHPFGDGNGRLCRLLMNLLLMRAGLPAVQVPRSGWERVPYFRALWASDRGDVGEIERYVLTRVIEACESLLGMEATHEQK